MNDLAKLALSCLLAIIWVFLNIVGYIYVLRRGLKRTATAAITGIATTIYVALGMVTGLAPNLPSSQPQSWLAAVAAGLVFFAVVLLWTCQGSPLPGPSWAALIDAALAARTKPKKDDDSPGSK